jgi:hypothetical protein
MDRICSAEYKVTHGDVRVCTMLLICLNHGSAGNISIPHSVLTTESKRFQRTGHAVFVLHDIARVETMVFLLASYLRKSTKETISLSLVNELFVIYKRENYTAPWNYY